MRELPNNLELILKDDKLIRQYLDTVTIEQFKIDFASQIKPNPKIPKKTIEQRRLEFVGELKPYLETYGRDLLNEFFKYWSEPNRSNTRMRFEMESTWALNLRLERWDKNNKPKTPTQINLKETPRG